MARKDDDSDDYDEVVLNKLVILLVKDVAALCFQERGVVMACVLVAWTRPTAEQNCKSDWRAIDYGS